MDREAIRKAFTKRLITNFLDITVIAHFSDKPFSGYDVLTFLKSEFDVKLSSGTVYSTLYAMERQGLIEGFDSESKRMYKVTERGKITATVVTSFEGTREFMMALTGKSFP